MSVQGATTETAAKWLAPTQGFVAGAALNYGIRLLGGEKGIEPLMGAVASGVLWSMAAPVMLPIQLGQIGSMVGGAAVASYRRADANRKTYYSKTGRYLGGGYQDSQQAYTMRQAGVQAINETGMQARQVLGNEASLMHR